MKKNTQSVKLIESVISKQPVEFQSIFEDLLNDKIAKLVESVKEDLHKKIFEASPADITGDDAEGVDDPDADKESDSTPTPDSATNESVILEGWDGMSHQAKELVLHADNNSKLEYSSKHPIMDNLMQKYKKNVYHNDEAKKLWGYHADRAAYSHVQENGPKDQPWHKVFPPAVRKEAAAHWEGMHRDALKANH